ncbi:MAG: DKNYY domain-containing protein [Flavobacteriales bacterium]|nr:DKNYY domain-containing protein [Flavobacteriales bacterium]MCL4857441.1 DKNYY domain-containing protein [Flavobacteriales bacterium]
MVNKILNYFKSKDLPRWFKFLNLSILLPISIWPYIFFTTIFFFDHPTNLGTTLFYFFIVNIYPLYFIILIYLNTKLFKWNKILGSILPILFIISSLASILYIGLSIYQTQKKYSEEQTERNKLGIIGNGFIKRDNKIFLNDSIIIEANSNTFEIVNWEWSKDGKLYFYHGKPVQTIDYKTFKLLDYGYAKDKNNVYYDGEILLDAEPKTFVHIEGTNDGRDKMNCFRSGEKVDCSVLLSYE